MYPSSTSSSSQGSMGQSGSGSGLMRYGSAPGSLLTTAVDSVVGATRDFSALGPHHPQLGPSRYYSETSSMASESGNKANNNNANSPRDQSKTNTSSGLQRSYGFHDIAIGGLGSRGGGSGGGGSSSSSPSLVRHSSSPAGFLNQLATAAGDNGFSLTRGLGSYSSKGVSESGRGISRLNSQLSFTRQEALSQISEERDNVVDGVGSENNHRKSTHSYATASFGLGSSWDDTNSIMFSVAQPSKRTKAITTDLVNGLNSMETQFQFGLPQTVLEMGTMDRLMHIPEDSVPCKIRAKRGCATHPRSIAERERRTRISGKLKKLQELVPNMDKQTSYADMLDLAVQHIKNLQTQVQKLNKELESCTCGCKKTVQ